MNSQTNTTQIQLDPENARVHDSRNKQAIKQSLKDLGAGRSILMDADIFGLDCQETIGMDEMTEIMTHGELGIGNVHAESTAFQNILRGFMIVSQADH